MKPTKILIAGGGTGGHVFPAVAVAEVLRAIADVEVVFCGTLRGIEARVVPAHGWGLELLDVEPMGPVHVHVAMSGGKAAVSVWAERKDSLEWLRGQGAELASALPAEVIFRAGTPGGVTPARGHFVDQTS